MSALASQWLLDTFIYTGLLIGLVLVLRRPVSRHFGPTIAYALWALPLLRFIMPPLVLPSSMAPVAEAATAPGEPLMVIITDANAAGAVAAATNTPEVGIALIDVLIPVWLAGALGFLLWRGREYVRMRADLLAEAKPVGESGKVRLVETPAVTSPVAFGIGDKVVALPPGFMALYDRDARDMAIAHELAHHRGFDLLANILAQPVLALHWFNPLAWWGWRAMRKDQEAACDARVVAGRGKSERAAYAQVIAGFAAGDDLALAAPMACPVLGEKSIIHRLRSLSMNEVPTGRRRLGIAVLATSALVLPLTASITYAQSEAPDVPAAPLPSEAALLPAPPAPPMAPQPAAAPEAPEPPSIVTVDPDEDIYVHVVSDNDDTETRVIRHRIVRTGDAPLSPEERTRIRIEIAEEMENARVEIARAQAEMARAEAEMARQTIVVDNVAMGELRAECNGSDTVVSRDLGDGRTAMIICQEKINDHAITGLRGALEAIRNDSSIPEDARQEAIEGILEAIEELEEAKKMAASHSFSAPTAARATSAAFSTAHRFEVRGRLEVSPGHARSWRLHTTRPVRVESAQTCDSDKPRRQATGLTV